MSRGLALCVALGAVVLAGAATAEPPVPPPARSAAPSGGQPGPMPGLQPVECAPRPARSGADDVAHRLQLPAVHALATGAGQLVAVIDTGVAPHPGLGDRLRPGADYLAGGDGRDDCEGHGTAVAGLVAARPGGPGEVIGMAPGAAVLPIRQSSAVLTVRTADGRGQPPGDTTTLAAAIVLAVDRGATVVNISEASCLPAARAAEVGDVVHAALLTAARADVVVVAAAGNVGVGGCTADARTQVALPGWYPGVLTVGAVGPDDTATAFTVPGPWVDVAAPGSGLRSLAVGGGSTAPVLTGTSYAAPWVAGLAALIRERHPGLTAEQVVDRIVATARRPAGGRDLAVGRGVVDPLAALTAIDARRPGTGSRPGRAVLTGAPPSAPAGPSGSTALVVAALLLAVVGAVAATRR